MDNLLDLLVMVRDRVLEAFTLPIGVSYWKFVIYMSFATIVIVALVNKLPIGNVAESASDGIRGVKDRVDRHRRKRETDKKFGKNFGDEIRADLRRRNGG